MEEGRAFGWYFTFRMLMLYSSEFIYIVRETLKGLK